jgi:hypothetical protein
MIEQECQHRSGYEYAKSLLQDKQRELRCLELRRSLMVIPREDYHSCRRSLLQAISQLETLLRGETDYVPPYEGEKRH